MQTFSEPQEIGVYIGMGFNVEKGTLCLEQGRLRLELQGKVAFDAPVAKLRLRWPWYGFGCQFIARVPEREYFVSFLHPGNTLSTWWTGIQHGRKWRRLILATISESLP
jgi:hypothetical protein